MLKVESVGSSFAKSFPIRDIVDRTISTTLGEHDFGWLVQLPKEHELELDTVP
jgi:hypothetical protein